jgi:acetolactate synthase I/III small subunit
MEQYLKLMINNRQGLIARIALLLERRGYIVTSLAITPVKNTDLSEMELRILGTSDRKGQIREQLKKLVDIIEVTERLEDSCRNIPSEKIVLSYN